MESEKERLNELLPRAIYALKNAMLQCEIRSKREQLRQLSKQQGNINEVTQLLTEIASLDDLRRAFAQKLGDRVVLPKS